MSVSVDGSAPAAEIHYVRAYRKITGSMSGPSSSCSTPTGTSDWFLNLPWEHEACASAAR